MTRWTAIGYPAGRLYPGTYACRYRLTHIRDDGLVLMTLGDQRNRDGRLSPVLAGFHFMTIVGRQDRDEPDVIVRTPHSDHEEASARHASMLAEWENMEI